MFKKYYIWIVMIAIIGLISYGYHKSVNENNNVIDDNLNNKILSNQESENNDNLNSIYDENINKQIVLSDENISGEAEIQTEIIPKEEENEIKIETAASAYATLSNKTNAWGFVRKSGGVQPELYGPYTKVLDAYEGIYMGNNDEQVVYLTFDEGYENGYTASILDTLKEKDITATFFVTMPYVKQNPDLVKRMISEGHIVGNHTVNHPSMPEVTDDTKLVNEVMELHNYIKENFNYEMTYLRPPKGEYSERTVKLCLDLGYRTVLWSSAYDDWDTGKQDRLDYARKMILNNVHNGNVMLLHAVSKDNTALLGEVIDEIESRGYEFLSLDEFER